MQAIWHLQPADPRHAQALAEATRLHPITAQLLLTRGVATAADAGRFLSPSLHRLEDPVRISGLSRAVDRLLRAIKRREPLVVFGDSDVDGITAATILYEALRSMGGRVRVQLSNRITDGYGLPEQAARAFVRAGITLVILVDCGTNQPEAVASLARHGIETIIIDHHVPLLAWAKPYALINPRCGGDPQFHLYCSAGLAFKVAHALAGEEALATYVDLAALGTLADYAPLLGDNRVIVSEGLSRIVRGSRAGLSQLCAATHVTEPEPEGITKRLIPRLNASGRLGDPTAVWSLLLREVGEARESWMQQAADAHAQTKALNRRVLSEAHEQVNRLHFRDQLVLVVSGYGWHQGVMGPLAAQLARRFGRPAIALACDEHHGVGSGRSVPSFDLLGALSTCERLLTRFGGHAQACGLTLQRKNVEPLRLLVNQQARRVIGQQGFLKTQVIDLELPLEAIQPSWVEEVERFAPFGVGNRRPAIGVRGVTVKVQSPRTGTLTVGRARMSAKGSFQGLVSGGRYDVALIPAMAGGKLTLSLADVRPS